MSEGPGRLERNLAALSSRGAAEARLSERIRASVGRYEILPSKSGLPTARREGRFLHSPRDPAREAEKFISLRLDLLDHPPSAVVILGFGLGYLLRAVRARLRRTGNRAPLLAVAVDAGGLRSALEANDLAEVLTDADLHLLLAPEAGFQAFAERIDESSAARLLTLAMPELLAEDPELFRSVSRAVGEVCEMHQHSLATLAGFASLWTRRLLDNCEAMAEGEDAGRLAGFATGAPLGIAAAGPTLSEARNALPPGAIDRILAVDTALPVLADPARGVFPPLVVTADAQEISRIHFEGLEVSSMILLASPVTPRSILDMAWRRRFFFALPGPAFDWFLRRLGPFAPLRVGGSVLTVAYDLAVRGRAEPILLFGADFSGAGRSHARGTAYDRIRTGSTTRFCTRETIERSQIRAGREALRQYARWLREEIRQVGAPCVRAYRPSPMLDIASADAGDLEGLARAGPIVFPSPSAPLQSDPAGVRREALRHLAAASKRVDRVRTPEDLAAPDLSDFLLGPAELFLRPALRSAFAPDERLLLLRRGALELDALLDSLTP